MSLLDGSTAIANGGSDSFGSVVQGGSDSKTFTVDNTGTATLSVSAINLSNSSYSLQTTLPLNIAAGTSATFVVDLSTSTVGTFSGQLSITDNDSNNDPYTVNISGNVARALDVWVGGGADNHWSTAANWQSDQVQQPGDDLLFQGASQLLTQDDFAAGTSFDAITFGSSGFSLAGNSFTVTSGITVDSGVTGSLISANVILGGSVSMNVATSLSMSGIVSGSGSLAQIGAGTLTLTGSNTYTGGTTLSAGTLAFTSGALGTTGAISFTGNSTLQWSGANTQDISSRLVINNGVDATLDVGTNNVTLASGFGGSGTGALTKVGSGTLTLAGNNSYSGGTTISAGTLQVGNNTTAGTVGSGTVVDNASLVFYLSGTATIANAISGSGTVAQSSSGTLIFTGNNTYTGTTTISGGTVQIGAGGTTGSLGAGSVTGSYTVLAFDRSNSMTVGNTLAGTISIVQEGTGILTFTGSNTYTGSTTINAGSTLQVGSSNANVLPK
jgi:autotransporter-associated beta strand protein